MCGRYQLEIKDKNELKTRFAIDGEIPDIKSNWNIAPSQHMPVVVSHSPNSLEIMQWGLVPFWEEKKEKPHGLINVRDDTITVKPWAKKYLTEQRCLIPASGFYEWKRGQDVKIPYYIHLKNKEMFAFAGLYTEYKNPTTGNSINTYTIITTSPNELMSNIHNRMPVIIPREMESEWLNQDMVEVEHIKDYLKPYPTEEMEAWPISSRVNSPRENDKMLNMKLRNGLT